MKKEYRVIKPTKIIKKHRKQLLYQYINHCFITGDEKMINVDIIIKDNNIIKIIEIVKIEKEYHLEKKYQTTNIINHQIIKN